MAARFSMSIGLVWCESASPKQVMRLQLDFAEAYVDQLFVVSSAPELGTNLAINHFLSLQTLATTCVYSLPLTQSSALVIEDFGKNAIISRIITLLPSRPDVVIGDDALSSALAHALGARSIPIGLPWNLPNDPLESANGITKYSKQQSPQRIALIGPQSSGKSTLAAQLANHFGTVWVPEYARIYANQKVAPLERDDVYWIARGQLAAEIALSSYSNRYLFVDTDAIMTSLYARTYYGDCPAWIDEIASSRRYDLYLLTAPDIPWVDDPQRDLPHLNLAFFAACEQALKEKGARYVTISGNPKNRLNTAIAAVKQLG